MLDMPNFFLALSIAIINSSLASSTWLNDNPDFYNQHILELVLAGSHKSCAYTSNSSSSTQSLNIADQFEKGVRFFDIPLEYFAAREAFLADWYCERGYTNSNGERAITEDTDGARGYVEILAYLLTAHPREIIVVYWRRGAVLGDSASMATLLNIIETELSTYAVSNTEELSSKTGHDLVDSKKTLIMFSEISFLSSEWIFNADMYLNFQVSTSAGNYAAVYSTAFQSVASGCGEKELMALQWYIGEDTRTAKGEGTDLLSKIAISTVNTMLGDFIKDLELALPRSIGNTILVDFVQFSDVLEQVTRLNIAYMNCNDGYSRRGTEDGSCKWLYDNGLCLAEIFWGACNRTCDVGLVSGIDLDPGRCSANELPGMYRDLCNTSLPCENPLGNCFELPEYAEKYYANSYSWCESSTPLQTCSGFDNALRNGMLNGTCMEQIAISIDNDELEGCDKCSDNAQCASGYCWPGVGVCATPAYDVDLIGFRSTYIPEGYSDLVYSSTAKKFRSQIAVFRSRGNPDAPIDLDEMESLDVDPIKFIPIYEETGIEYFDSLWSCAGIPCVLTVILIILFVLILFFRCCCGICCTDCCRHKPNPPENRACAWCHMICALVISVIVGGFSLLCKLKAEEMLVNVFGDEKFLDALDGFLSDARDHLNNVEESLEKLKDNTSALFDSTEELVSATTNFQNQIEYVESNYNSFLSETYETVSYEASNGARVTFICIFCEAKNEILNSLDFQPVFDLLRDISNEVAAADDELLEHRQTVLNAFNEGIDMLNDVSENFNMSLNEYKMEWSMYANVFWIPCIFLVVWLLAVCIPWDCWFAVGWFSAMWLSIEYMVLLTVVTLVGMVWADVCVKLDMAEEGIGTTGFDITTFINLSVLSVGQNMTEIVDCCFEDCKLLEMDIMGDLNMELNFSTYQNAIHDQNRYSVIKMTDFEEWRYLVAQVEKLNISTFYGNVDTRLVQMNSFVCDGELLITEHPVTRNNLAAVVTDLKSSNGGNYSYCPGTVESSVNAFGDYLIEMVQEETLNIPNFTDVVEQAKGSAEALIGSVNTLTEFLQNMKDSLEEIECLLNPLVYDVEVLLDGSTARCGFIGKNYGEIKQLFCEDVFANFALICLGVTVITMGLLLIFIFYIRLQRRWNYTTDDFEEEEQYKERWRVTPVQIEGQRDGGIQMERVSKSQHTKRASRQDWL